jgi:hypothetical protein
MRLLIYLLAMLTGFSAAEAARPALAVPAPVDATAGQAYAAAAVKVAAKAQISVDSTQAVTVPSAIHVPATVGFAAIGSSTPVLRRDVILA